MHICCLFYIRAKCRISSQYSLETPVKPKQKGCLTRPFIHDQRSPAWPDSPSIKAAGSVISILRWGSSADSKLNIEHPFKKFAFLLLSFWKTDKMSNYLNNQGNEYLITDIKDADKIPELGYVFNIALLITQKFIISLKMCLLKVLYLLEQWNWEMLGI